MTNVVVLPTSAPRQVHNLRYAEQREAYRAARREQPWPGENKSPWKREQERQDAEMDGLVRTPELLIAMTLLSCADDETKRIVRATIELAALTSPCDATRQALALAKRLCKPGSKAKVEELERAAEVAASVKQEGR